MNDGRSLRLLALAAFLSLGLAATGARADDDDGSSCGTMPGDADAVAATRAAAAAECNCANARNHGSYVSCVSHVARDAVHDGALRAECKGEVVSCAAHSTCGRDGFVTCCRTDAAGNTRCSIKRNADRCRPPKGGSACVGAASSCCDACSAGGGCPGTSTTTAPPTTSTTSPGTTSTTTASTTSTTAASTTSTTAASTTSTTAASTTSTTAASTTSTTAPTTTTTTAPTTTSTTATTSTTTTVTTSTTTTTSPCCPAGRISTTTAAGTLVVGTLTAFPFPAGVSTTLDIDGGDATCKHNVVVPANGFSVPIFCIPALNFTSQVTPLGCQSGGGFGNGSLWDANSTTADADVSSVGDTSDGVCNPAGQPCGIVAGGASNNTLGDIDTTIGNGTPDPAGVNAVVSIPVDSLTWSAADASCPDSDGQYNDGVDTQISRFQFILRPTTATANASFVDKNADSCSRGAGTSGPNNTRSCSNDHSKPCGANTDCVSPGTCGPAPNAAPTNSGALQGSPAAGPCCVAGQTETLVATGIAFSGGSPLFDLIFANTSPTTVSSCGAPVSGGACVLSTDTCKF